MLTSNDTDQLANEAKTLIEINRLQEARNLYTRICEIEPANSEAWFMSGVLDSELGAWHEAIICMKRVVQLDPRHADAHFHLASLLFMQEKLPEALASCQVAVKQDPNFAEAWSMLGSIQGQLGNLQGAEQSFRKAMELGTDSAEAHCNLGNALRAQGKLADALSSYKHAVELDPGLAQGWFMLGVVSGMRGMYFDSKTCLEKSIALHPGHADSHLNLATACTALGDHENAITSYRAAIRLQPSNVQAYSSLAHSLSKLGRFDEAVVSCKHALQICPHSAEAHCNLGNALMALGKMSEAEASYQDALRARPAYAEAYSNLGILSEQLGKIDQAIRFHRRAVDLNPNNKDAYCKLATSLKLRGLLDEALAACEKAIHVDPDCTEAVAKKAAILEQKGNFSEAYGLLRPLITSDTKDTNVWLSFARLSPYLGKLDEGIAALTTHLKDQYLSTNSQRKIHHLLGVLYERCDKFDQAFRHHETSSLLAAGASRDDGYRPEEHAAAIGKIITTYGAETLALLPRATHLSDLPVFIVGMPRSGTTLVEQIIASHPEAFGAGELPNIPELAASAPAVAVSALAYPDCIREITVAAANALADRYIDSLRSHSGVALRITDKLPHNFLYLGLIALLFPASRVIHVRRDPVDTCLSCYFQDFSIGHSYAYNLSHVGNYYQQYQRLMTHWRKVLDIPILNVDYEALVTEQEGVTRAILEFCQLPWDDKCIRFHETARTVATPSYGQVRRPMYRSSVGRWKHYRQYLDPLITALGLNERTSTPQ